MFCLLGVGIFSHAQDTKKNPPPPPPPAKPAKPAVIMGDDAIPVTVKNSKKGHWKVPPPPPKVEAVKFTPPKIVKDVEKAPPPPPPKAEAVKFTPPKIVKDAEKTPPPPPPKPKTPIKSDAPPKDPKA